MSPGPAPELPCPPVPVTPAEPVVSTPVPRFVAGPSGAALSADLRRRRLPAAPIVPVRSPCCRPHRCSGGAARTGGARRAAVPVVPTRPAAPVVPPRPLAPAVPLVPPRPAVPVVPAVPLIPPSPALPPVPVVEHPATCGSVAPDLSRARNGIVYVAFRFASVPCGPLISDHASRTVIPQESCHCWRVYW